MITLGEGTGPVLDLGGRHGELEAPVAARGYTYVNLDFNRPPKGVQGDAHRLPFPDGTFTMVLSVDTLEHFSAPWTVLDEVRRVLVPGGRLVVSVPWMHPFHGDDLWRYSPLGLRRLLENAGLTVESFEGRDGLFTAVAATAGSKLPRLGPRLVSVGRRIDRLAGRFGGDGEAAAHAFHVVAAKPTAPAGRSTPP